MAGPVAGAILAGFFSWAHCYLLRHFTPEGEVINAQIAVDAKLKGDLEDQNSADKAKKDAEAKTKAEADTAAAAAAADAKKKE